MEDREGLISQPSRIFKEVLHCDLLPALVRVLLPCAAPRALRARRHEPHVGPDEVVLVLVVQPSKVRVLLQRNVDVCVEARRRGKRDELLKK